MIIIKDTREQDGWNFENYPVEVNTGSLMSGDYSLKGLENMVAIERKSKSDLLSSLTGSNRVRLKNELERLRAYPYKALIAECSWHDISSKNYRSAINPNSVYGSICSWCWKYRIPVIMAGDKTTGQKIAYTLFNTFVNNYMRVNKAVAVHINNQKGK